MNVYLFRVRHIVHEGLQQKAGLFDTFHMYIYPIIYILYHIIYVFIYKYIVDEKHNTQYVDMLKG